MSGKVEKMMMKTKKIILTLLGTSLLTITTGCGQTPFGVLGGFQSSEIATDGLEDALSSKTTPYALLSSEQVYKSMSSLTGTPFNNQTMNEYNARQAVLASGFDLKMITSPMLISITNLASVFCNETLSRESALPADQRKFFGDVDFSKGATNIDPASYSSVSGKLSMAFWGRSPSSEEAQVLNEGKNEFVAALAAADAMNANSSRNLMLFTCTGMLSSFDTYTF